MKSKLVLGVTVTAIIIGGIANSNFRDRVLNTIEKKETKRKLGKYNTYISSDSEIAEIQKSYGINHLNSSIILKNGQIYNPEQRIKNFLKTPKGRFIQNNSLKYKGKNLITSEGAVFLNNFKKFFKEKTGSDIEIEFTNSNIIGKENKNLFAIKNIKIKNNGKLVDLNEDQNKILEGFFRNSDFENQIIYIKKSGIHNIFVQNLNTSFVINNQNYDLTNKNFKKISVNQYLDKNGLDISTKIIMQDIFSKAQVDYSKFTPKQQRIIDENMINFIKYITEIESDGGKYLENSQGSTAKGPFQILDGYKNGIRDKKYLGKGRFTTFEKFLRTYIKYANNLEIPDLDAPGHPTWVNDALLSKGNISPNELTQEQNINLFLVGTFLGDSHKNSELLIKVLVNGDKNTMEEIYKKHHSNPDLKTKGVMVLESIGTKLKNIF